MKNYQESDYAANKFSPNIVYRFADGTVEVTLEDYLKSSPGKTEQDFAELKALSDEIYHEQVIVANRTSRLDVTSNGLEETEQMATLPLDVELIEKGDKKNAVAAAEQLLNSGDLTAAQRRRFILYFYRGKTTREIAAAEGAYQNAVWKSIHASERKLKKLFSNGWSDPLKNDNR